MPRFRLSQFFSSVACQSISVEIRTGSLDSHHSLRCEVRQGLDLISRGGHEIVIEVLNRGQMSGKAVGILKQAIRHMTVGV